jgi:hypothetical protein
MGVIKNTARANRPRTTCYISLSAGVPDKSMILALRQTLTRLMFFSSRKYTTLYGGFCTSRILSALNSGTFLPISGLDGIVSKWSRILQTKFICLIFF